MGWKSCRLAVPNKVSKQTTVRDNISEDIFHFAEMWWLKPETIQTEH
jgi:hypothetical protein